MSYVVGIDLGTSYSAAAVGRADGQVEMFQLGQRTAAIPSVVVARPDDEMLVGEPAARRALTEPGRAAREFKRRLGDPVPLVLGGTPYGPEALLAVLLHAILRQITEQEGGPPDRAVITHPASYGPYKLDLLRQAAIQAEVPLPTFVSEPVAAAIHYAGLEHVPTGATIAVYDFGGGTLDVTLLEKTAEGFEVLGTPEGLDRLGGIDFDEALFRHVLSAIGAAIDPAQAADPAMQAGLARLREECRQAKEALSSDTDAAIAVALPGIQTEVRVTRAEFEAMIDPRIAETVAAVRRAARSADVRMVELDRILLIGGTSRIPRIAEEVHAATGRPVAVDAQPKHGVALGAARVALDAGRLGRADVVPTATAAHASMGEHGPDKLDSERAARQPVASGRPSTTAPSPRGALPGRAIAVAAAVGAATLLLAAVVFGGGLFATAGSPTEPPRITLPPAPSALPTPPVAAAGLRARITSVTAAGDRYEVDFETTGFVPAMGANHVHFFWNTVGPEQAGAPAAGPYVVYAGSSPFRELGPAGRPGGATAICIVVANADHTVIAGSGGCAAIP